jgi:hypothetical protein
MRALARLRMVGVAFGDAMMLTACPEDPAIDEPLENDVEEPADGDDGGLY